MFKFNKPKYKVYFFVAIAISIGVTFGYKIPLQKIFSSKTDIALSVKDFPSGTDVNYKIISDGKIIKQGQEKIGNNKMLNLPLPKEAIDDNEELLDYKLAISNPNQNQASTPAQTLDLLLSLNKNNGNISLSGSGIDSFSDIKIKNGDKLSNITSDWAGLFSLNSVNENLDNSKEPIEIAFQNYGITGDVNKLNSGKIEVYFGDATGSNRNAVRERYTSALIRMTHELSNVMVLQTEAIGMFFDATNQLRTQRKHQELQARAHKDYHPSEQMCRIGTFIRSLAHTQSHAELNKHALNKIMMRQYSSFANSSVAYGTQISDLSKLDRYKFYYCDPRDSNAATAALCPQPAVTVAPEIERLNKDIDYARILGNKLTVDVDFVSNTLRTDDETDLIALAKNLYFPNAFEIPLEGDVEGNIDPVYNARSFAAKMNVAHSSFINIVGMKANAPEGQETTATRSSPLPPVFATGVPRESNQSGLQTPLVTSRSPSPNILTEDTGWAYMKAMLREFGITDDNEINHLLGARPSYYAQMEVLTKKIYQHPNFYTNLYDKPANVERISASIDAITLMHQRDRFESLLRREMLTSVLLEDDLSNHTSAVSSKLFQEINSAKR